MKMKIKYLIVFFKKNFVSKMVSIVLTKISVKKKIKYYIIFHQDRKYNI